MKSLLIFLLPLCYVTPAIAQDCKGFYYLLNNAEIEMTVYDGSGAATGKTIYKVNNVHKDGDGVISDFSNTYYDKNSKQVATSTGHFKCSGNGAAVDMKMNFPSMPNTTDTKMEGKSNGAFLDYPSHMQVGQELQGGSYEMKNKVKGMEMVLSYTIRNRRVTGRENVTTAAGSWNCYVISYDLDFQMTMMNKVIPRKFTAVEWFAPAFGPIKTASFSEGKKMGGTLITGLKK
ncbi:TapB family protein [Chitinophaga sp. RAB17]|uniref:TapB family protein n=1 Tax=Chitinophaga sp. RAB17 TaxID=3233049 RepID=UPI003F8D9627